MIALLLLVLAAGGAAAAVLAGDVDPAAVLVIAAVLTELWLLVQLLDEVLDRRRGRAQTAPGRRAVSRAGLSRVAVAVIALSIAARTPRRPRRAAAPAHHPTHRK